MFPGIAERLESELKAGTDFTPLHRNVQNMAVTKLYVLLVFLLI